MNIYINNFIIEFLLVLGILVSWLLEKESYLDIFNRRT